MSDNGGIDIAAVLSWIKEWMPGGLGAMGVAMAYRIGNKVGVFDKFVIDQLKINDKTERRLDEQTSKQNDLVSQVSSLPTRDEIQNMFGEIKEDIRAVLIKITR